MSVKLSNNKTIIFISILGLVLVLLLIYWLFKPDTSEQGSNIEHQENQNISSHFTPQSANGQKGSGPLPVLADSLRGTEIDCPLQVDANGKLVLTVGIRSCFDYFFSSLGEKTESQLMQDIRQYLTATLPEAAATYGSYLLEQYVAYTHALGKLKLAGNFKEGDIDAFQNIMDQTKKLQRQYFNEAEIQAFFGHEQRLNEFSLAQLRIHNDKSLSTEQKASEVAKLIDQLPPTLSDGVRVSMQFAELQQLTQEIKQQGGSASDIRAMRENLLGKDAADRLEKVDQEEAGWQQQVNGYLAARDQILKSNDSDANKQQAINALRGNTFNSKEDQLRAQTYEMMHDRK